MTFENAAAHNTYLPHPKHEKFKSFALPHIEKVEENGPVLGR